MQNLAELIQRQTSYSELVVWIQAKEQCNYLEACLRVNEELKQYRLRYTA